MRSRLSFYEPPISKVCRLSVLLFVFVGLGERSQAGCHYGNSGEASLSEEDASRLVVTENGFIQRRGDVQVVYEYGEFKYYSRNDLGPCKGPGCKKRENESSLTLVVSVERQRCPLAVCEESRIGTSICLNQRPSSIEQLAVSVSLDGVFRPPCTC
jgi:hypothetical protein